MGEMFGSAWISKYGPAVDDKGHLTQVAEEWAEQFAKIHPRLIARAIEMVRTSGREWPPSQPEFIQLCREPAAHRSDRSRALPPPPEVRAKRAAAAKAACQVMRATIRQAEVTTAPEFAPVVTTTERK